MSNNQSPRHSGESGTLPVAVSATPRTVGPRRLAACGDNVAATAWAWAMRDSGVTQDAIAVVLEITQQTTSDLIRTGRITTQERLSRLAANPATQPCVLAFAKHLSALAGDRRSPDRTPDDELALAIGRGGLPAVLEKLRGRVG